MNKDELLDELKKLGFSVKNISELSQIPEARIYKWYKKKGLPKLDDYNKLKELYERMKPNPTLDFMKGDNTLNLAAEDEAEYTPENYKVIIKLLKKNILRLETRNEELIRENEFLKTILKKEQQRNSA